MTYLNVVFMVTRNWSEDTCCSSPLQPSPIVRIIPKRRKFKDILLWIVNYGIVPDVELVSEMNDSQDKLDIVSAVTL